MQPGAYSPALKELVSLHDSQFWRNPFFFFVCNCILERDRRLGNGGGIECFWTHCGC